VLKVVNYNKFVESCCRSYIHSLHVFVSSLQHLLSSFLGKIFTFIFGITEQPDGDIKILHVNYDGWNFFKSFNLS
jgi:hypothetical protein